MDNQFWSWLLTIVGVTGFILAGRKVWWAWYINLACQILWFAYAIVTGQYGFIVAALVYSVVFTQNAVKWTREHREKNRIRYPYEWAPEELRQGLANEWASPNDARRAAGLQPYEDTKEGRDILAVAEQLSRDQIWESHRMKFFREMQEAKYNRRKELSKKTDISEPNSQSLNTMSDWDHRYDE